MIKFIYNNLGDKILRKEKATPVCGQDFCESCGDCLSCYGRDYCPDGIHTWIVYEDELEAKMNQEQCVVCGKDLEIQGDNFNWWWYCKNPECARFGLATVVTKKIQPKSEANYEQTN